MSQRTGHDELVMRYHLEVEFQQNVVHHRKGPITRSQRLKESWNIGENLGRGNFGVVRKENIQERGHYRAVKVINTNELPAQFNYSRELRVLALLAEDTKLFLTFLGWFEQFETLYIAMEYAPLGDLRGHLNEEKKLSEETVREVTMQLLEGLTIMHGKGIAHRDVKPENIFVFSLSPVSVKLGDFGVSKQVESGDFTTFHTQVVTPSYAAPEVLGVDSNCETSVYTEAVDIWSLGCVVYELLAGQKLFRADYTVSGYFWGKQPFPEAGLRNQSPPTSEAGISLVKTMVSLQPGNRPSASGARNHSWFGGSCGGLSEKEVRNKRAGYCILLGFGLCMLCICWMVIVGELERKRGRAQENERRKKWAMTEAAKGSWMIVRWAHRWWGVDSV